MRKYKTDLIESKEVVNKLEALIYIKENNEKFVPYTDEWIQAMLYHLYNEILESKKEVFTIEEVCTLLKNKIKNF